MAVGRLAERVALRQAGSPPSETARMAILRKPSLACASVALNDPGEPGISGRMAKNDLDPPRRCGRCGTMNGHQRTAAALIRPVPTGRPVGSAVRSDHSRDFRQPMPPIPDGFLTNERISVRIPATPAKTRDA